MNAVTRGLVRGRTVLPGPDHVSQVDPVIVYIGARVLALHQFLCARDQVFRQVRVEQRMAHKILGTMLAEVPAEHVQGGFKLPDPPAQSLCKQSFQHQANGQVIKHADVRLIRVVRMP